MTATLSGLDTSNKPGYLCTRPEHSMQGYLRRAQHRRDGLPKMALTCCVGAVGMRKYVATCTCGSYSMLTHAPQKLGVGVYINGMLK